MKKWMSLALAGILASMVLVGCGDKSEGDTAGGAPSNTTKTDAKSDTTPATDTMDKTTGSTPAGDNAGGAPKTDDAAGGTTGTTPDAGAGK